MPKLTERSRPRQEPVSCLLCRQKKLKCNRQQPCSNCLCRGLPCQRQNPLPTPASSASSPDDSNQSTASILARLQRLEDVVSALNGQSLPALDEHQETSPPSVVASNASESEIAHKADTRFLEQIGTTEPALLLGLADGIMFRIIPIQQLVMGVPSFVDDSRCICLPTQSEAAILFDFYLQHIDYLQHVIHVEMARRCLDGIYEALHQNLPAQPSHVALLLSIIASSCDLQAILAINGEMKLDMFSGADEASRLGTLWTKACLDVLDYDRRTGSGSLEIVQAYIIIGFLMFHLEGFSPRTRFHTATTVSIARDIGLHRVDLNRDDSISVSREKMIDTEMKRRVWWQLCATDWIMAFTGSPQEGIYSCDPRHTRVRLPRNLNDDDIEKGPTFSRPLSEPTIMAYFLQRIRLAHICKDIVDTMSYSLAVPEEVDYQHLIALDDKFVTLLRDLPVFFRLDEESIQKSRAIETKASVVQRYFINLTIHTRRGKLHLPFLARGSVNPRYKYSRDICIQCARNVIELFHKLQDELIQSGALPFSDLKLSGVLVHIFMSIIVFVMDLCVNQDSREERKAEVEDACNLLERASGQSLVAKRFLGSLRSVLHKHKIRLQGHAPSGAPLSTAATDPSHNGKGTDSHNPAAPINFNDPFSGYSPAELEDLWQTCSDLPDLDMTGWDDIFSDLGSQIG